MPISATGTLNNRGFTLLELTVVIALISLFALISFPVYSTLGENDLERAARRLTAITRHLFNEAALTGKEHRLVFDPPENGYRAFIREPNGELVPADRGRKERLPTGVRFYTIRQPGSGAGGGQVTARIFPVGWMTETIVYLADEQGRKVTVRLPAFTGSGEIYGGMREF